MRLELFIGLRYLLSKKTQMFISLISVISVLGVALGVMALIVVLSVQAGFEYDLKSKILGNSSHLVLLKYAGDKIVNYRQVAAKVREKVPEITGCTPTLYHEVLLTTGTNASSGVMLKGIDPETAGEVLQLKASMLPNAEAKVPPLTELLKPTATGYPRLIVGWELSRQLLVFPGDIITLLSPEGEITPFGNQPRIRRFEVAGIFKTGMWEYDNKFVYTDLPAAQRFLGMPDVVSYLEMRLANIDLPKQIGAKVSAALGPPYFTRDWQDLNGDLFDALRLERTVTFLTLAMVIVVAAFSIVATLVMMVLEKAKEIAILKAMGATSRQIMKTFMLQGAMIGFIGTALGEIAGIALAILVRDYIKWPLNPSVYFIDTLPVRLEPLNCAIIGGVSLFIALIATVYPAWKASSLDPIEGLRYE